MSAADRLELTLDLFEFGVEVMRSNLRRRHADAGEREIERRLAEWLRHRPGAEHGDAPGPIRNRPG